MRITADHLTNVIDFDAPFHVDNGEVFMRDDVHAPTVENDDDHDILVESAEVWEAFSVGYTGQYAYNGAVMHASETLSGRLAEDILSTPGTYVVTAVEAPCTSDDPCFPDDPDYCERTGCDATPAGWTVLKLKG